MKQIGCLTWDLSPKSWPSWMCTPDKQMVLFSATFPSMVENLPNAFKKPIEVVVGGRTKASSDIEQFVEVRRRTDKFQRLLQLLACGMRRKYSFLLTRKTHAMLFFRH